MIYIKFIISLLALPLLLPWQLAEKADAYVLQPALLRRYHLPVSAPKLWFSRIFKMGLLGVGGGYLLIKIGDFIYSAGGWTTAMGHWAVLPKLIYNDMAHLINAAATPLNRMYAYLHGQPLVFRDFFLSLYLCVAGIIFVITLLYRQIQTRYSISKAKTLRNRAVRNVNIVRHAESAGAEEIFLGLDLRHGGRPFFARRQWLKGHLQVVGEPGSGKTESIIQPLWYQHVRRNVATFVLDGKASRHNVDKFYTIAASLAQGQDVFYFNPADPALSDTYNPLLHGSAGTARAKIMASIDWSAHPLSVRERADHVLRIFLRTMEQCHWFLNFRELLKYFESPDYLRKQFARVSDPFLKNGLREILDDFAATQSQLSFFVEILRDIEESGYGELLNTGEPHIDIVGIYEGSKDVYFTVPSRGSGQTGRFLGLLILQDFIHTFQHLAAQSGERATREGLLVIDEMRKFVTPDFLTLLQICREVGVSVCYTNQSLEELEQPGLGLPAKFAEQLAIHTNALCCFSLAGPESHQALRHRLGPAATDGEGDWLRHLDAGQCIFSVRRPQVTTLLKTGYFEFDQLMRFNKHRQEALEGILEA